MNAHKVQSEGDTCLKALLKTGLVVVPAEGSAKDAMAILLGFFHLIIEAF